MAEPTPHDVFESILSEMTGKAAQCAMESWAEHEAAGCIGDWKLPVGHRAAMKLIEHGYKIGYSLALLDHVQKAIHQLKGLGDAAIKDGVESLRSKLIM